MFLKLAATQSLDFWLFRKELIDLRITAVTLAMLSLMTGCTTKTVTKFSVEQAPAISSLAIQNFSTDAYFSVEYQEVDNSSIGIATAGLLGLAVTGAMDTSENNRQKSNAEKKAQVFNEGVDPANNAIRLKSAIAKKFAVDGIVLDKNSPVTLDYRLQNLSYAKARRQEHLSPDTRFV